MVARPSDPKLRIDAQVSYTAIADARGLRLDVWPFSITRAQHAAFGLVRFWDDGRQCSVGCRAPGASLGWPLRPFHRQHPIRAGLNELRPANFHIGIDIEARNDQAVFPIESGLVRIVGAGTPDEHVQVGQFQYWHINHTVFSGQYAVAYRTELGRVKYDFRHVHLSELGRAGQFLNPLRPGGTLGPYHDTEAPIIGIPRVFRDGSATVGAFDPQSFVAKGAYETPVLAPAALAWRLFNARGRPVTALAWALRGTQNYPPDLRSLVFASGTRNPGYNCFAFHHVCVPHWVYRLAGGLTPPLPVDIVRRGRYRLTVYAWDWAGNATALDHWITVPVTRLRRASRNIVRAAFDYP